MLCARQRKGDRKGQSTASKSECSGIKFRSIFLSEFCGDAAHHLDCSPSITPHRCIGFVDSLPIKLESDLPGRQTLPFTLGFHPLASAAFLLIFHRTTCPASFKLIRSPSSVSAPPWVLSGLSKGWRHQVCTPPARRPRGRGRSRWQRVDRKMLLRILLFPSTTS